MTIAQRRIDELRKKNEIVTKRFDTILVKFKRKKQLWLPFYDTSMHNKVETIEAVDGWILDDLVFWHRTIAFDHLSQTISEKEGEPFDAWGPFELPSFDTFTSGLSEVEQTEFWSYLEERKSRTLEVEADYGSGRASMTFARFTAMLHKVSDVRQRFRFLASVRQHLNEYRFGQEDIKVIEELYAGYYSQLGIGKPLIELKTARVRERLKWTGSAAVLSCFLAGAKNAKMLDASWDELAQHFEWDEREEGPALGEKLRKLGAEVKRGYSEKNKEPLYILLTAMRKEYELGTFPPWDDRGNK